MKVVSGDPFTLDHFRGWASQLELDNGERWALEPFQEAFVTDLFTGVKQCWLILPEANGKTTLIAGLSLYHCLFKKTAFVPVAASSEEQAKWLYVQAHGLVIRSDLEGDFKCLEGFKRVVCRPNGSRIQIFSSDSRTGDGVIPTLCILDELHRHKNMQLYRTWAGKLNKRKGAQLVAISTAGEPGDEFELQRERIRKESAEVTHEGCFVRARSDRLILHEYAVPEGGDIEDMELVKQANPLSTITVADLRAKRDDNTMTVGHWSRFTCNMPTRGVNAAITEKEWFAAAVPDPIPIHEPVWLGLDLGWKHDTTAMVPLWIRDAEFRQFGPATILEPPGNGDQLDAHLVEQALWRVHDRNPIHTVVMDMTDGAQLSQWIQEEIGATVIDRVQSVPLHVMDYARFMEALRYGWLHHSGDPGLTRHCLNAVSKVLPLGDTRFERPHASRTVSLAEQRRRVIDALVAAAMVHTAAAATLAAATDPVFAWG